MGFNGFGEFLSGKLENKPDILSWVGTSNSSWYEVKEKLFKEPVKDFSFRDTTDYSTIKIRMFPLSCFEILKYKKVIWLKSTTSKIIYFSDPFHQPSFRLVRDAMAWDPILIGNGKNPGETSYYEIDITVTEKRNRQDNCRNYENPSEYGECVDSIIKKKMIDIIGCIPPWIKFNMVEIDQDICTKQVQLTSNKAMDIVSIMEQFNHDVKFLKEMELVSEECKPPCTQMKVASKQTSYASGNWSGIYLNMLFNDIIKIHNEVTSYDIFSLCVEVGSSLGLWIGLSAMGVFHLTLTVIRKAKGTNQIFSLRDIATTVTGANKV